MSRAPSNFSNESSAGGFTWRSRSTSQISSGQPLQEVIKTSMKLRAFFRGTGSDSRASFAASSTARAARRSRVTTRYFAAAIGSRRYHSSQKAP